jgi:hypothetical protein
MASNLPIIKPSSGHARNLHRSPIVDEELADQVWEAWDGGEIDDNVAWLAWLILQIA